MELINLFENLVYINRCVMKWFLQSTVVKVHAVYKDIAFVFPLLSPEKTRDNAYQTEKQINNAKPSVSSRSFGRVEKTNQ